MTLGTGPQALVEHIATSWQQTRSGRGDVTDVVRDGSGNALTGEDAQNTDTGILVTRDRQVVERNTGVHDLIHCYHPEGSGLTVTDNGYKEKNVVENVQIDIETTDRTDQSTGTRLFAVDRMVGDRSDGGFPTDETPPYPGILGECIYTLELKWRGLAEWDVTSYDPVNVYLGNSNANVSLDVELEHVAANTVV